jgi:hypothetical protein
MKKSDGSKIQSLEREIIEAMKETGLVEHPHFYHRGLYKADEPITLAYSTPEMYTRKNERHDPFSEVLPLQEILVYGVLEIKPEYDELSRTHRWHIKLDPVVSFDAIKSKCDLLKKINEAVVRYNQKHPQKKKR